MSCRFTIRYIERSTGAILTEKVYAERFLFWAYNTPGGWWMMRQ